MDQIFDRLGNLLKSVLQDDTNTKSSSSGRRNGDQDMQDAWEELDSFLNEEDSQSGAAKSTSQSKTTEGTRPKTPYIPKEIHKDYANLEVPVGAPMEEIRKSYKRLLVKYHPDRHASHPDRFETATKVTQKINESFQRIKKYQKDGTL